MTNEKIFFKMMNKKEERKAVNGYIKKLSTLKLSGVEADRLVRTLDNLAKVNDQLKTEIGLLTGEYSE